MKGLAGPGGAFAAGSGFGRGPGVSFCLDVQLLEARKTIFV